MYVRSYVCERFEEFIEIRDRGGSSVPSESEYSNSKNKGHFKWTSQHKMDLQICEEDMLI
jgi:hypothetical protein